MMPRARVVARILPSVRALRGRPIALEIRRRLDAALDESRIELVIEPDEQARLDAMAEAEFYLCENDRLPRGFYRKAKRLRLIQAGGYFFDRLKPEEAARHGIPVVTFPMPITDSVADHTMAFLLMLVRNTSAALDAGRRGTGRPTSPLRADGSAYNWTQVQGIRPLRGLRMGILGLGDIGRGVAMRARAFGMEVRYWNRSTIPPAVRRQLGAKPVTREELFRRSDALFVGVGLNAETRGIVSERELRALPKGAYLLNIGRGPLVDQDALYQALMDGHLGGAGLDVFDPEPFPTDHPLLKLPNVLPTPHLAGGDDETIVREVEMLFGNVLRVLDGRSPIGITNGVRWRKRA